MKEIASSLPVTLQQVRKARRISQLELSLRMGVSQRHISFVEGGRAKPSRELLITWLNELNAPLAISNAAMLLAGYAPSFSAAPFNDPSLDHARDALTQLLLAHEPMPALVLDVHWNLVRFNRGTQWLASILMPWAPALREDTPANMLDLLIHPEGFAKLIINLHEVGPTLLAQLRDQATVQPTLQPKVDAFAQLLRTRLGGPAFNKSANAIAAPLLTTRFATALGELTFFSMFTTFGTPQDITLASLRVEQLFAADEFTRNTVMRNSLPL
jgi:transcriptional regulator with XRE-family HTH domain